ncbi:hypothetical protein OE88DRAFT_1731676 [Heliocybe sulcata]|uniref:Uncharacterized protein n=1 Tax=Heliocybe sulcata TaxID=5364 RepID=A0A5C3NGN0_9AGAM|nr:hypothetical protein OE88DRAFT_1731676 [Heliocybe sulcata]
MPGAPNPRTVMPRKTFMQNWFAIEAIPMYAIVALVVGGGSWYLSRLAMGPTIIWTKSNPTPWNDIKPDENAKLMSVNGQFDKSWKRERL